uniref:Nicotinamide nucleotide adenylyltransferase 3 n=1 Tax=Capra hircus TaxID=9925 RepID=A0A8C2NQK9_CAPHI
MPVDFTGYWKMLANENFEEYLRALDVNVALRKIANLLKPDKEIVQEGDHMIIRTLSTFRNYIMDFQVGKEFEEDLTGIDDRKCMPLKIYQTSSGYPAWAGKQEDTASCKAHVPAQVLFLISWVTLRKSPNLSELSLSCIFNTDKNRSVFCLTHPGSRVNKNSRLRKYFLWKLT